MEHNFFLTNEENQDSASALAYQFSGAVITLGTTIISGEASCSGESDSALLTSKLTNGAEFWTLKVSSLGGFKSLTYADTGVESALLSTGVIFYSDLLPIGVFGISLPSFVLNQEKAVLSYIADVLREHGHFATVVTSDGSSRGSKTFTEDL